MYIPTAIIGHSFATRLGHANGCLEQYLRVDDHISPILTYGISGARIIESHLNKLEHYVRTNYAHVVIIELGTNDLQLGTCPLQTASNLITFANILLGIRSVDEVYLFAVTPRARSNSNHFNELAERHNNYLYNLCTLEKNVFYIKHSKIHHDPKTHLIDGLHPWMQSNSAYCLSLRKLLFSIVTKFSRLVLIYYDELFIYTCGWTL